MRRVIIKKMNSREKESGFSLLELVIYVAIFAVSSTFLVAILTSITRVQVREKSANEVNHQIGFVGSAIERLVQDSSLIDIDSGTATSSLVLRMASTTLDPTTVFASGSIIYIQEATSTAVALTDSRVNVDKFSVTKFENPGGKAIVHVTLALSYSTDNLRSRFSKAVQLAVSKISAANFDSNLVPNTNNNYDLGSASYNWKDGYFAGNIGVGVAPSSSVRLITNGDIAFTTSTKGLVFTAPNGTSCFRLTITNGGALSTSSITCP